MIRQLEFVTPERKHALANTPKAPGGQSARPHGALGVLA